MYIPTVVGEAYSLMPRIAPNRVWVGRRYSMVSLPKMIRVVASTSSIGAVGSGTGDRSAFTS